MTTRDRIVAAATEAVRGGERLSVRAIAAKAGVGASTLRHYFPTQRDLLDTVLAAVYEEAMPDDRIHDRSVPAADRLLECLQRLLAPIGSYERARETWQGLYEMFIGPESTEASRLGFIRIAEEPQRRVESWLSILQTEGAIPVGDTPRRARFLLAVVDGLSIGRALPSAGDPLTIETEVLRDAIAAIVPPAGVTT